MILSTPLLGALRCFDVAARHCNFTHASAELHLTPSAVSQQIRQLEQHLGQPLFIRQARGLALTPFGLRLQEITSEPLSRLAQGIETLRHANDPLQVTCSSSFAMLWLMPRLPSLHRSHPELEIKLIAEFQSVDRQGMQASGTHCAIRYDPVAYHDLQAVDLMPEMLIPVASPRYLTSHDSLDTPTPQLAGHTLLHDANAWGGASPGVEWQLWLDEVWGAAVEQLAAGQQQFNLSTLALAAARNHQGVAMGRAALISEDLEAGTLVAAHPHRVRSSARYVFLSAHGQDPRVKVLLDWLTEECRQFQAGLGQPSLASY